MTNIPGVLWWLYFVAFVLLCTVGVVLADAVASFTLAAFAAIAIILLVEMLASRKGK